MKKKRGKERGHKKEKKYKYNRTNEIIKLIVILLVLIAVCVGIYYFAFYTKSCENEDCFSKALIKCERASWINDGEEATWLYNIESFAKGKCRVDVRLLQIKKGKIDIEKAQKKEMSCYFPIGISLRPEQNLESCTGELKEILQELIIKRMHSYILENLEEINVNIKGLGEIANLTSPPL